MEEFPKNFMFLVFIKKIKVKHCKLKKALIFKAFYCNYIQKEENCETNQLRTFKTFSEFLEKRGETK